MPTPSGLHPMSMPPTTKTAGRPRRHSHAHQYDEAKTKRKRRERRERREQVAQSGREVAGMEVAQIQEKCEEVLDEALMELTTANQQANETLEVLYDQNEQLQEAHDTLVDTGVAADRANDVTKRMNHWTRRGCCAPLWSLCTEDPLDAQRRDALHERARKRDHLEAGGYMRRSTLSVASDRRPASGSGWFCCGGGPTDAELREHERRRRRRRRQAETTAQPATLGQVSVMHLQGTWAVDRGGTVTVAGDTIKGSGTTRGTRLYATDDHQNVQFDKWTTNWDKCELRKVVWEPVKNKRKHSFLPNLRRLGRKKKEPVTWTLLARPTPSKPPLCDCGERSRGMLSDPPAAASTSTRRLSSGRRRARRCDTCEGAIAGGTGYCCARGGCAFRVCARCAWELQHLPIIEKDRVEEMRREARKAAGIEEVEAETPTPKADPMAEKYWSDNSSEADDAAPAPLPTDRDAALGQPESRVHAQLRVVHDQLTELNDKAIVMNEELDRQRIMTERVQDLAEETQAKVDRANHQVEKAVGKTARRKGSGRRRATGSFKGRVAKAAIGTFSG